MLKWKVCIAVAGRSLQAGRSLTIPWETPRVDARASPPGRPPGWTPASPPLNPQDPPNHLSHSPNGFESNVCLPLCPLILSVSCGAAFRLRLGEQCYGKCDACLDAFASAHKALLRSEMSSGGAASSPRGSSKGPPGFSTRGFLRVPPRGFLRAPQGLSQRVAKGVPQGWPQGFLQGFPLDS